MNDEKIKSCPKCNQQLRFPKNIGGMVMQCPSCGYKYYSDFKLKGINANKTQTIHSLPNIDKVKTKNKDEQVNKIKKNIQNKKEKKIKKGKNLNIVA